MSERAVGSSAIMLSNRSMPAATVIPVLVYEDVAEAVEWLCDTFGFTERLRIGTHRVQLSIGDGAVVVTERRLSTAWGSESIMLRPPRRGEVSHTLMVRIEDIDAHYRHARSGGALIVEPPTDHAYGERQYTADDLAGHRWTFSQSIADVAPEDWGGESVQL